MFRKIRRPPAVSYFFFCEVTARETSTRAAKPLAAMKRGRKSCFAIALHGIRTRRILREKADCEQSKKICHFCLACNEANSVHFSRLF